MKIKPLDHLSTKTPIIEHYETDTISEVPQFDKNIWTISNESILNNLVLLHNIGMKPMLIMEKLNVNMSDITNSNPYDAIFFYSNYKKLDSTYKISKINIIDNLEIVANIIGQQIKPIDTNIFVYEIPYSADIITMNGINEYKYEYVTNDIKKNIMVAATIAKNKGYNMLLMDSYGICNREQPIKSIIEAVKYVSYECNIPIMMCVPIHNNKQNGSTESNIYKMIMSYIENDII